MLLKTGTQETILIKVNLSQQKKMTEAHGLNFREKRALTILGLFLLISYFVPGAIQSALFFLYVIIALFSHQKRPFAYLLKVTEPLWLLFLLGTVGGIIHGRTAATFPGLYELSKDGWYTIKGILAFWVGVLLMENIERKNDVWKPILWAAVIVAICYLFLFSKAAIEGEFSNVRMLRRAVGPIPILLVGFACAATLTHPRLIKQRFIRIAAPSMSLLCTVLSFSRMLWICTVIMLLSMAGVFSRLRWKAVIRVVLFSFFTVFLAFAATRVLCLERAWSNMMSKVWNSFSELQIDSVSMAQNTRVYKQWRGFETHRAWEQYRDGEWWELLAGHGYGTMVNIGFYMPLAGKKFRYLPVLHNGYLKILLTTGVIGLSLFIFFFFRMMYFGMKSSRSKFPDLARGGRSLLAVSGAICLSTFVMGGFLNKGDHSLTLLLGIFYSYVRFLSKSEE